MTHSLAVLHIRSSWLLDIPHYIPGISGFVCSNSLYLNCYLSTLCICGVHNSLLCIHMAALFFALVSSRVHLLNKSPHALNVLLKGIVVAELGTSLTTHICSICRHSWTFIASAVFADTRGRSVTSTCYIMSL